MKISDNGLDLIKEFEGLRLKAYKCPAGVWTIGYGTTKGVKPGDVITEEEASELLRDDVRKFSDAVDAAVKVGLNQNQYDALVSFTYNVGAGALRSSTLVKVLNKGDYNEAADQFLRWNRGGGRVLAGLTRRRKQERELFLS